MGRYIDLDEHVAFDKKKKNEKYVAMILCDSYSAVTFCISHESKIKIIKNWLQKAKSLIYIINDFIKKH